MLSYNFLNLSYNLDKSRIIQIHLDLSRFIQIYLDLPRFILIMTQIKSFIILIHKTLSTFSHIKFSFNTLLYEIFKVLFRWSSCTLFICHFICDFCTVYYPHYSQGNYFLSLVYCFQMFIQKGFCMTLYLHYPHGNF